MPAEFVIVGGGVYGCAVAYHLASSGASVHVLEAGRIAEGASGGFGKRGVRANSRDLRELPLMREAYELWPDLHEQLGAPTGFERTGGINLVEREVVGVSGGLVAMPARASAQRSFGIPTEIWNSEQVRSALPGVSEQVKAGLYAPLDGIASQEETTAAYAAAAHGAGAVITEKTTVTSVESHAVGATVVTHDGEHIAATRSVLLASNAGVSALTAKSFGQVPPIWTLYPQAMLLESSAKPSIPLLTGHDHRALSVKVLHDDVVMLSGGWRGRYNPETRQGELDPEALDGNIEQLTSVFPHLGELNLIGAEASRPESVAVDQVPLIGEIADHVYVTAGWSGHGWALVPSASRHIAGLLKDGQASPQLAPLALTRIPTLGGRDA